MSPFKCEHSQWKLNWATSVSVFTHDIRNPRGSKVSLFSLNIKAIPFSLFTRKDRIKAEESGEGQQFPCRRSQLPWFPSCCAAGIAAPTGCRQLVGKQQQMEQRRFPRTHRHRSSPTCVISLLSFPPPPPQLITHGKFRLGRSHTPRINTRPLPPSFHYAMDGWSWPYFLQPGSVFHVASRRRAEWVPGTAAGFSSFCFISEMEKSENNADISSRTRTFFLQIFFLVDL